MSAKLLPKDTSLALIHRAFVSRDENVLLHTFWVYVRPLLEFSSIIWSPWLRGTVVERWSVTGELFLSCARPAADG